MQLMHGYTVTPTVGQRPDLLIAGDNQIQMRCTAEQEELRQIGLAMSTVGGRIDEPTPVGGPM